MGPSERGVRHFEDILQFKLPYIWDQILTVSMPMLPAAGIGKQAGLLEDDILSRRS